MKVVVPLAGPEGEAEKEFKDFKNLIEVYGKPLIRYIAEKRPYDLGKATFILLKSTDAKYAIAKRLKKILGSSIEIFMLERETEGAPCSVMEYLKTLHNDPELLIDLVDQHLSLDKEFVKFIHTQKSNVKGIIPTFKSRYWKWSYIRLDRQGYVTQVQEKVNPPLSDNATAGVYYFSSSKEFVRAAEQMVAMNKRAAFNNKFFVSCVYNEFPPKSIITFPAQIICPLGSVEGIKVFPLIAW